MEQVRSSLLFVKELISDGADPKGATAQCGFPRALISGQPVRLPIGDEDLCCVRRVVADPPISICY